MNLNGIFVYSYTNLFSLSVMANSRLPVWIGVALHQLSPLIYYVTKSIFLLLNINYKLFSFRGFVQAFSVNHLKSFLGDKVKYEGIFSRFRHIRLPKKTSPRKPA